MTHLKKQGMPRTDHVAQPRANEMHRGFAPASWLPSARVIAVAVKVLPTVEDDIAADIIEQQALALVDRDAELKSLSTVLSVALDVLHASETQTARPRQRVTELLKARRREVSA